MFCLLQKKVGGTGVGVGVGVGVELGMGVGLRTASLV